MAKHPELTGEFLHVPGYIQPTDPGAVGGGMLWVDTSGGPSNYVLKIRNDANTAWVAISGGGAGATNFTGLTDTPASYAGQAGLFARVNGTETALEFAAAAGVADFVSLSDTPANYAGAALFGVRVNAGETGLEFVDFTGEFLPLVGGIMTGNIDFADLGEGIRFDDGAGVKFNGIKFEIVGDPEIVIGEEAPDIGGHPIVRANGAVFRIGEGAGTGFGVLEMWSEDAASWIPIINLISDNPGDPLEMGSSDNALDLKGSEVRPTYEGSELALLSDVSGGGSYFLPHYNVGVGVTKIVAEQGVATSGSGSFAQTARVRMSDILISLDGGGATPAFSFQYLGGLTVTIVNNGGTDPEAVYIDFLDSTEWAGGSVEIFQIKVDDGVQAQWTEAFVLLQDSDGIGF